MTLKDINNILCDYLQKEACNDAIDLINAYFPNEKHDKPKHWFVEMEDTGTYEVWNDTIVILENGETISLKEYFAENDIDEDELIDVFECNPLAYFDSIYHQSYLGFKMELNKLPVLPEELQRYK